MNYYYEIKLNFNDTAYLFYEWNNTDKLEYIKKIPVIKIKSSIMKKIITNNFKVSYDFLNIISGRTLCKNSSKIENACIFCDTKNCIAIEFDNNGYSIARSNLMLEDENNICEIAYSFKYRDLELFDLEKIEIQVGFRQENKIKNIINKEIIELYNNKNIKKIEYLYYEWFGKIEDNIELMVKNMYDDLKENLKEIHYEIYKIIKLSYSKI